MVTQRRILLFGTIILVASACGDPSGPEMTSQARHGIGAFGSGHLVESDTTVSRP